MPLSPGTLLNHRYRIDALLGQGQYLVMNFIEGEELAQRLKRLGPQPEAEVLRWADDVLSALAYLHKRNIIHRDIELPRQLIIRESAGPVFRAVPRAAGRLLELQCEHRPLCLPVQVQAYRYEQQLRPPLCPLTVREKYCQRMRNE